MRLRTWLAYMALLTTGLGLTSAAVAQGDPFAGGGYPPGGGEIGAPPFADPGCQHGCPPGAHGHGGGMDALHGASVPMGPGGFAPGTLQAFPQISPYETGLTQHRQKDGLWYRDTHGPRTRYYSRLSATLMTGRDPNKSPIVVVGDPINPVGTESAIGPDFTVISTTAFEDDPDPLFPRDLNQRRQKQHSVPGVRGVIGWVAPGSHGVEFNAWLTPGSTAVYQRGLGGNVDATLGSTSVSHGLSLPNGIVPYDQLFRISWETVYAGGGVNFMSNDIWPSKHVGLRVMYGVRYLHLNEEFAFRGVDSGGAVTFGNDGLATTLLLDPTIPQFDQRLYSRVRTNLVGPQIGLDYNFGGDFLQIQGQSKAGVMLNFTNYEIGGVGIGDPFTNLLYDRNLAFRETDEHSHLTPLIEQNLRLEIDAIPMLPVLKNVSMLRNSKIHVGYAVVLGWEIARPHNQIVYRNQPNTPGLRPHLAEHRTQWYTHGWEFGFTSTW